MPQIDIVDRLGDLIADHYSGDSVQTMVPPISTLLAAQDETLPTTAPELIQALRPFGLTASSARNLTGRLA